MRLYTLTGAASVSNDEHGTFEVDPETGAVEVPEALGRILHGTCFGGRRVWEDDAERSQRLVAEDLERRRDPAVLYDLLQQKLAAVPAVPVEPQTGPVSKPRSRKPKTKTE